MSEIAAQFLQTVWFIISESAPWLLVSLVVGGIVHEFLPSSRFRSLLARKGHSAMLGGVLLGACLPICSCGVIPLAISLYRSGVRLGPVMAFTAATPIINPAAVILSLALLGPQITLAYVALGLLLPLLMGAASERWGDSPTMAVPETDCGCEPAPNTFPDPAVSGATRTVRGLRWGLFELGPTIGYYMTIGVLLAGLLGVALPSGWIDAYLSAGHGVALVAAAAFGAMIYVCAVAHVPLVATLVAASAVPGVAIVFLVTGTATNLPELLALYKTIGKRTVIVYTTTLVVGGIVAGVLVNAWLLPGFTPTFDPLSSLNMIEGAEALQISAGALVNLAAAWVVVALAALGTARRIGDGLRRRRATAGCRAS